MRFASALIMIGALALGGCNRHQPEEGPVANNLVEVPNEVNASALPPESNAVENVTENKAAPAPPPKVGEDEQIRDDADATGLTARLPDGEGGTGQSENQTRPAE